MNKTTFPCKFCGSDVAWATSKTGKRYLAQPFTWHGTDPGATRTIQPAHECEWNDAYVTQSITNDIDDLLKAIDEGRIRKDVPVEVVKGRKVPIGTKGFVFWVADEKDAYGVTKVGVMTNSDEKIYINIENLKVSEVQG